MGPIPQSPDERSRRGSSHRDTGFPEPFCGERNTTLAHPDAKIGPDACISADDVAVGKALHRSRRSFLSSSKHKRTLTHGRINPMDRSHSDGSEMFDIEEVLSPELSATTTNAASADLGWHDSKMSMHEDHSSISAHGDESKSDGQHAPASPSSSTSSWQSSHRRTFLSRLRRHK